MTLKSLVNKVGRPTLHATLPADVPAKRVVTLHHPEGKGADYGMAGAWRSNVLGYLVFPTDLPADVLATSGDFFEGAITGCHDGLWDNLPAATEMDDSCLSEVVWDTISYHADDMRVWKEQLGGRTLDHWKDMVAVANKDLSEKDIEKVATSCRHLAEG